MTRARIEELSKYELKDLIKNEHASKEDRVMGCEVFILHYLREKPRPFTVEDAIMLLCLQAVDAESQLLLLQGIIFSQHAVTHTKQYQFLLRNLYEQKLKSKECIEVVRRVSLQRPPFKKVASSTVCY